MQSSGTLIERVTPVLVYYVLTCLPALNLNCIIDCHLSSEIVTRVAAREDPLYRPKLSNVLDSVNLPGMKELAEKCWNEILEIRPDFEEIRKIMRKHSMGK